MSSCPPVGALAPKRPLRVVAGFHTGDNLRSVGRFGMQTDVHLHGDSGPC